MKLFISVVFLAFCVGLVFKAWPVFDVVRKSASADPTVWQKEMDAFAKQNRSGELPENGIVFVGSSSFRLWSTMNEDLAPLAAINRGFGGAILEDINHWAEVLVGTEAPTAVVVFCGTNDIRPGGAKEPETLLATYQSFVGKVRALHPDIPIYYIAITPSPSRWEVWDVAKRTNKLITEYSDGEQDMFVIDTGKALLAENGEPDPENYVWDKLHLSKKGYAIWTELIKPRLVADLRATNR